MRSALAPERFFLRLQGVAHLLRDGIIVYFVAPLELVLVLCLQRRESLGMLCL